MAQSENPRQKKQNKPGEGSVQAFLEIAEIKDDILVMKDSSMRAVLMTSSINFDLKSEQEQEGIVLSYQDFLNSLNFPIQILTRSRKLILDSYIYKINKRAANESSPFIKNQLEQYKSFITSLLDISNIMDKQFYIIVPFFPSTVGEGVKRIGFLQNIGNAMNPTWSQSQKADEFKVRKAQLMERVSLILDGLSNVGLSAAQLSTTDLVELFYDSYNLEEAQREKLVDVDEITAKVVQ